MMWFIGALAAVLAFLAGLLSYQVPLFACVVAWACGVVSGILVVCAVFDWAMREDYVRWTRTGEPW